MAVDETLHEGSARIQTRRWASLKLPMPARSKTSGDLPIVTDEHRGPNPTTLNRRVMRQGRLGCGLVTASGRMPLPLCLRRTELAHSRRHVRAHGLQRRVRRRDFPAGRGDWMLNDCFSRRRANRVRG